MIGAEKFTQQNGAIPGVQIASKTGTAEHGTTRGCLRLLDRVVAAVEQFESGLKKPLSVEHKSRLIGLLYEKSQLLTAVAGEALSPAKMRSLLKLVA